MESKLSRAVRRAGGVYYTPVEVVREVVEKTLYGMGPPLRVLDPACGAGAMLIEARRPGMSVFGIDCDPTAVQTARRHLDALSRDQTCSRSGSAGASPSHPPQPALWVGDALFDNRLEQLSPFDAIVANPPYVNIRQLAKSHARAYIERLRQRFRTARGNFDLYVVFLERALELLRPGGRCGMIIPNKWATLDYARPLRELLLAEATIDEIVDLSSQRVFAEASVYPHILIFSKSRPAHGHRIPVAENRIRQCDLTSAAIALQPTIDVESRVGTQPLGDLCTLSCGTPGYSAQRVAAALLDVGQVEVLPHAEFITSGNIDRYAIRLGQVRFLGHSYERPVLPLNAPGITERQRTLFTGPKIVIAGMSQRLEAAWDSRGLALGVQVFAASQFQVDPQYLLALLNSKLLTYLFRTRFAAKRLAGGYMAINKGQLARLPIVVPGEGALRLWRKTVFHRGDPSPAKNSRPSDAAIDQWIYRLYRLTKVEIAAVETHLTSLGRRAA